MVKFVYFVVGAALVGFSFLSQGATNPALKGHVAGLQAAQSLQAKFTVATLPGAPEPCTLSFSKPDRVRIETPTKLIVCDGKNVYELDKTANTYTQQAMSLPQAHGDNVAAWSAFFDPKAYAEAKSVAMGAKRKIKGNAVTEVAITLPTKVVTLYVDDKTGIARGASIQTKQSDKTQEVLVLAEEVTLGAEPLPDSGFTFSPPPGAKLWEAPKVEHVPYQDVQAIFNRSCTGCHGSSGGLSLASYASVMQGAGGRPVVVAGNVEGSSLVHYIKGTRSPRMPKGGAPLSAAEIKRIADWIQGGAKGE